MPELPEVETVRAGLERHLTGKRISTVQVHHPRSVRRHPGGPEDFQAAVAGRVFEPPKRRGKYLWLPFTDGDALSAHLGMSGQFRVVERAGFTHRHLRIEFLLDDGSQLLFLDQRLFGGMWLSPQGAEAPGEIAHIAADPLSADFDIAATVARMRSRKSGIKRLLLDQSMLSGIGNIYADEALWRAKLHYDRPACSIPAKRLRELLQHAQQVLCESLAAGGTSFDALYVDVAGESGYFERSLAAYGREGLGCLRCGEPLRREPFMGRSSFRCPKCQPVYRVGTPGTSTVEAL
jgi:formamidopyrimidine-DNA glycosylase